MDLIKGVRFPTTEKTFLSATTCGVTLGVHPSSSLMGIGVFSRVKRPGHERPLTPSNVELRIPTAILGSRVRLPGVEPGWRQVLPCLDHLFIPSNCKFLSFALKDFKIQKQCHLMHVCMVSPYLMLSISYRWDVLNSKPCLRSHFR